MPTERPGILDSHVLGQSTRSDRCLLDIRTSVYVLTWQGEGYMIKIVTTITSQDMVL